MTYGLNIFARSMSAPTRGSKGKGFANGKSWQYHPRSDRHSKILCWAIVFDLLTRRNLISRHVAEEKISFGINHRMLDFTHKRKKDLDLVICRRTAVHRRVGGAASFHDMVNAYTIVLTPQERSLLDNLPDIPITGVQTALIAVEAKAAMTEFGKAQPRIYDELNSSQLTVHGDTEAAIAAGFVIVNLADTFISPTNQSKPHSVTLNSHTQPKDAVGMMEKIDLLPRRSYVGQQGFDALGLAFVKCINDGTAVELVTTNPSPRMGESLHYDSFIERMETIYASRFAGI